MTNWKHNLVLIAAAFLIATMAWGQGATGTITGNITDASGATVVGAKVTVKNTGTGAETSTTSNDDGIVPVSWTCRPACTPSP